MFPVTHGLNLYILCSRNWIFKGLILCYFCEGARKEKFKSILLLNVSHNNENVSTCSSLNTQPVFLRRKRDPLYNSAFKKRRAFVTQTTRTTSYCDSCTFPSAQTYMPNSPSTPGHMYHNRILPSYEPLSQTLENDPYVHCSLLLLHSGGCL